VTPLVEFEDVGFSYGEVRVLEHIDLTVAVPAGLGRIKADPGQIQQVILNLVVNARDAMPDGGRLVVEAAAVEKDGAEIARGLRHTRRIVRAHEEIDRASITRLGFAGLFQGAVGLAEIIDRV